MIQFEWFYFSLSVGKLTHEKKRDAYHGVSAFLNLFEDPTDTPEATKSETREERLERKRKEKAEANEYKLEQVMSRWIGFPPHKLINMKSNLLHKALNRVDRFPFSPQEKKSIINGD